ncbi:MAG TPA: hypothetical protein VF886_02385 [Roseiarcus sp.]
MNIPPQAGKFKDLFVHIGRDWWLSRRRYPLKTVLPYPNQIVATGTFLASDC